MRTSTLDPAHTVDPRPCPHRGPWTSHHIRSNEVHWSPGNHPLINPDEPLLNSPVTTVYGSMVNAILNIVLRGHLNMT
jgi:hypothetical protein